MRRYRSLAKGVSTACLLIASASVIFAGSCVNPGAEQSTDKSHRAQLRLHGKVQSYAEYTVVPIKNLDRVLVFEAFSYPAYSCSFSEAGNKVEATYFDTFGTPVMSEKLIYDAEMAVRCVRYKCDSGGSCTTETSGYTNYYGDDREIDYIRGHYYDEAKQSEVDWLHLYEYLEQGSKIVISGYHEDSILASSLQWRHIQKYRGNRLVEVEHRDKNGTVQWIDRFRYDSNGNKTEWARYASKDRLEWIDKFKYDDAGNEIESSRYDSSGHMLRKHVFRYVKIPTVGKEDDTEISDNLFLSKGYDPNRSGDLPDSFDQKGNWTVKVTLEENNDFGYAFLEVREIQKRDISYYE